jgi:hypothetical protein
MVHCSKFVGTALLLGLTAAAQDRRPQNRGNQGRRPQQAAPVGQKTSSRFKDMPAVDEATRRGLKWLAAHQDPAGHWSADVGFKLNSSYQITAHDQADVGVTALALMAFLAGGHVPGRGEYGLVLERGLQFVISCAGEDGYLTRNGTRMYSHAFATLLLAEAYGMTRREDVRDALQRAINLIVTSQNESGGWRYQPFARASDMSITVCQVMALRAARNIGINVPYSTIEAAVAYVRRSAVDEHSANYSWGGESNEPGAFRYQDDPGSRATFPLTAAGLTTLYGAAVYEDPLIKPALGYMKSTMERFNDMWAPDSHYFFYYGHYYAVQAFFMAGGADWEWYYSRMSGLLLSMQQADGSWPNGETRNSAGPGPVFGTAVACIVLQIRNQYLPIFQR